jgi:hypothetical protein
MEAPTDPRKGGETCLCTHLNSDGDRPSEPRQVADRRISVSIKKRLGLSRSLKLGGLVLVLSSFLAACDNPLAQAAADLRSEAVSAKVVLTLAGGTGLDFGGTAAFGLIPSGTSADLTIGVANSGKSPLAIDLAGISFVNEAGTAAGTFSCHALPASPIASGAASSLVIRFSPTSSGPKKASISIPTNDFRHPVFSFTLQGSGSVVALNTVAASSIGTASATGGGNITNDGGDPITARGLCWDTSPTPTTAIHSKTNGGSGTGSYSDLITGLSPGTLYYVRAWAVNSAGTTYGPQVSFTTLPVAPAVPSVSAIPYAAGSGKLSVSWTAVNGSDIYYDVYCDTTATRPGSPMLSDLTAPGCTLLGLVDYSSYYVWVVAKNVTGSSADSPTMTAPVMVGIKVSSITLSKTSATFLYGSSETITATCLPETATLGGVTWSSNNASAANVTGGIITGGNLAGSATITASAADGQGASATFAATTKAFMVTDTGPAGGILFYDKGTYSDGWRYMEAAPVNIGSGHAWTPKAYYVDVPGAYGLDIGTGLANTDAIVAAFGSGTYLARDCRDYALNGYKDWFMPSGTEAANLVWYALGGSCSSFAYFVSSTQTNNGQGNGCKALRSTDVQWVDITVTLSGSTIVTRPVRRF